jgi:HK97 gp10 family phage protein
MADDVTIKGLDGVLDAMSALESKVQKKAVGSALRAGAKPIQAAARRNAQAIDDPATAERIAGQITTRTLSKKTVRNLGADAGVGVGVLRPHGERDGLTKDEYLAGWFNELGTAHTKAQPFMRPAGESESGAALNAIAASLQQSIFGS